LGMLLLAADCALGGLTAAAMSAERLIFWQKIRLGVVALVPGTWLTFSLCYSPGNYREFLARWRMLLVLAYATPIVALVVFGNQLIRKISYTEADQNLFIGLGLSGKILYLTVLLSSVLILLNLERTFRS